MLDKQTLRTISVALGYFFVSKMKLLNPVDHPESISTAPTFIQREEGGVCVCVCGGGGGGGVGGGYTGQIK